MSEDKLLYLDSSDIAAICADIDPLLYVSEALRQHAEGTARVGDEGVLRWSPAEGHSARTLNMPGLLAAPAIVGTKIINANTGNPGNGLPRADGLTLLFDPSTARPAVILQAAEISALRTAAVSTLAALQLQNGSPIALALLGAGKIAETHAVLMAKNVEIDSVFIYDQAPERGQVLAEKLRAMRGSFHRVETTEAEYAVSRANVVVAATTTTTAYVPYDWISRGTVVLNVSLDDIDADAYIESDLLYVDDWQLITADTQRLLGRLAREGKVSGPGDSAPARGRSVTGTIGQLLAGTCPARENAGQTVLVNPFGMAIEDLALARAVHMAAVSRGLGTPLDRLCAKGCAFTLVRMQRVPRQECGPCRGPVRARWREAGSSCLMVQLLRIRRQAPHGRQRQAGGCSRPPGVIGANHPLSARFSNRSGMMPHLRSGVYAWGETPGAMRHMGIGAYVAP